MAELNGNGHRDDGALRAIVAEACLLTGGSLKDFTVLAAQHDPFRVDTPAGHRDGAWLAEQPRGSASPIAAIHLRGLHYAVVSAEAIKPNGMPYTNTDADWMWMSGGRGEGGPLARLRAVRRRSSTPATPPIVTVVRARSRCGRTSPPASKSRSPPPTSSSRGSRSRTSPARSRTSSSSTARRRRSSDGARARSPRARQADLYLPTGEISRHAAPPDGLGRRRRRPPDDRPLLLGLRPGRLADADLDRPQAAGVQGARSFPELDVPGAPGRAHPRPGPRVRLAVHAAEGDREARRTPGRRRRASSRPRSTRSRHCPGLAASDRAGRRSSRSIDTTLERRVARPATSGSPKRRPGSTPSSARRPAHQLAGMNDPKEKAGWFYACSSEAKRIEALSKLSTAATRATKALNAHDHGDEAEAFRYYDLLFGGRFPAR